MEIKLLKTKMVPWVKKNKSVVIVLLIGVLLMMIPGKKNDSIHRETSFQETANTVSIEKRLTDILSKIKGVGLVEVMLTIDEGQKNIYQMDIESTKNGDSTKERSETVIISTADRTQSGLLLQENPPVYRGAIVICQGGDEPSIKLAVTEAFSKITGVKSNAISVLKMK